MTAVPSRDVAQAKADAHAAKAAFTNIFWPANIIHEGFLYGWKVQEKTICIAGVLRCESHAKAVRRIEQCSAILSSMGLIPSPAELLGRCSFQSFPRRQEVAGTGESLLIRLANGKPCQDGEFPYRFILYQPPDARKLRFLSQHPLDLGTTAYSLLQEDGNASMSHRPSKKQDPVFAEPTLDTIDFEAVLARLNVVKALQHEMCSISLTLRKKFIPSTSLFVFTLKSVGKILDTVLKTVLLVFNHPILDRNSLKDLSAACHQLDVRLQQAYAAPVQYRFIYRDKREDPAIARAQYISFYNMLWLIANDAIIGSALAAFIIDNNEHISRWIARALKVWSVKGLQNTLLWLNDWPGGLKLNYELGTFFCDAFLWFTALWEEAFLDRFLLPNLPQIVKVVGLSATVGATMSLAMISDLLSLSTFHLYIFYSMATTVFSFHTHAMGSLFNIFRGKKRNVIRNRTEPSDYTLDQLLVGAILFTLAAFLLPTVLAFYLAFVASRCSVIAIHAGLEAILAFLNHFPLFAMMLRVKDSDRLPGGLAFRLQTVKLERYLVMTNNPIPMSAIFHQYWALWSSFSQHYSPVYLLGKVLTGRYINPIPRSRLTFVSRTAVT